MKVHFMSGYYQEIIPRYGVLKPDTPFIRKPLTLTRRAAAVRKALDAQPTDLINLTAKHLPQG